MSGEAMLSIRGLWGGYHKAAPVIRDLTMDLPRGQVTALLGPNGCGKSTLLRLCARLLEPAAGEVLLDGRPLAAIPRKELARLVSVLPQGRPVSAMPVYTLVSHGRFPYLTYPRKYRETDVRIARQAMEQMGIAELSEQHMSRLSGGMRQKVYIAMALAGQAPVIVMDEPTTYLDIGQQVKFAETVRQLADEGKTVVLVLHDILLALKISARIAALGEGKVIWSGTPEEMLAQDMAKRLYGVAVGAVRTGAGTQYFYEIGD